MKNLTKKQIKDLILFIVNEVDYDHWKALQPKYAEDPECAKEQMKKIVKSVEQYLERLDVKICPEEVVDFYEGWHDRREGKASND